MTFNHRYSICSDQKLGMSGSLEECQQLLVRKDRKINEGEGKVNALQIEVDSLKNAKLEVSFLLVFFASKVRTALEVQLQAFQCIQFSIVFPVSVFTTRCKD